MGKQITTENNRLLPMEVQSAEQIKAIIATSRVTTDANDFVSKYYEAESKCNLPKWVFFFSEKHRNQCKEARMVQWQAFGNLLVDTVIVMEEKS